MSSLPSRVSGALSGHYRLEDEIGAGGMATVYLAQDLRHDRRVAVKVLRPELAAVIGAERFLAEIKLTANLQHPHILPLFDSGEADSFLFYVMPYVEGESLRDRLNREKQLPVDEAIRIASEVASALDYAHRHGVIHRDIKPENILLHDGRALVADFGIALAASKAGGSRMTETGMSLGTPHYMSPEQAMGEREITARSDVYALGAVLYEMLSGDPPFTGSTAQAVVARVVTESPRPLLPQRHTIPPHVEAAVITALEKLPADRFATAAQFAEALARPGVATTVSRSATAITATTPRAGGAWAKVAALAPWAVALLALGAAGFAIWRRPAPAARQVVRFGIQLPRDAEPVGATGSTIAFSPDGSQVVYVGKAPSGQRLYSRRMDLPDPVAIPGSEGARLPFFSPDKQWLGFVQGKRLVKVALAGGPVTPICAVAGEVFGATWTVGDSIVFGADSGLMDVPASGGTPRMIARPDTGESFRFPEVLPGDRAVVFGVVSSGILKLAALDRRSGKVKRLAQPGGYPRYVTGGFLVLFDPSGILSAVPFDAERLEVTGPARPIADKLNINVDGDFNAGVSRSGDLAYQPTSSEGHQLVMVDRAGTIRVTGTDSGYYYTPRFAPDGRHVALLRGTSPSFANRDVWVFDLVQHTQTRVTFDTAATWPVWSPDGRRIVYTRFTNGTTNFPARLYWVPADGSGSPQPLVSQAGQWRATAFEPGGRAIVYSGTPSPGAKEEIWRVGIDSGAVPTRVLATAFDNGAPSLSPDGRWLAYTANESGRDEVYVRSYPGAGGRWQVSLEGGSEPIWSPKGDEIFYRNGDAMLAAAVRTQPAFEVTGRTPLFQGSSYQSAGFRDQDFSVSTDGKTFAMLQRVVSTRQAIVVTLNWFDQFRAAK
jgi:Tol biopolymer transport system component/tRNA A-37 threonylcarbamoyl transferase component Bud32